MPQDENFQSQFRQIQLKFSRLMTRSLTAADLTMPQYALLNVLEHDGHISMTEASKKLHLSKPAVTNLADRLVESRMIQRSSCPEDRRVCYVAILPKGSKSVKRIQSKLLGILMKAVGRFSENERGIIRRFYATLSETVDTLLEDKS